MSATASAHYAKTDFVHTVPAAKGSEHESIYETSTKDKVHVTKNINQQVMET
jgi:hypothetical protein